MKIVVLTGAGISAPSGIPTYRDSDGLWTKYDQVIVSRKGGFETEQGKEFWGLISKSLEKAEPNAAHLGLAKLEKDHEVVILTTNIDDLHEKAGSQYVVHMHGCYNIIKDGHPDVVLFGDEVKQVDLATIETMTADVFVSIGTSDNVAPACDLITMVDQNCRKIQLNMEMTENSPYFDDVILGCANRNIDKLISLIGSVGESA